MNYYAGRGVDIKQFDKTETTPKLASIGVDDDIWNSFKQHVPDLWEDEKLKNAGEEFAQLIEAQRAFFQKKNSGSKSSNDFAEKASNYAVLSAWAFVAGMLAGNTQRLRRHYRLRNATGKDPLNSTALAKGRHKTDPENYRGLGYRTDPKERGRFVELFYAQTEKGEGIKKQLIDYSIKQYHAKQAVLEAKLAEAKV